MTAAETLQPVADITLGDAQEWLSERMDDGAECPCCGQLAKVYRRKIHAAMARDLVTAWRRKSFGWFHVRTTLGHDGGDFAKLAHWNLIEAMPKSRDDGSPRTGWWRLTPKGTAFVRDLARVQKYALIYDGQLLRLDGTDVGIRDALGSRFNYSDLMAGV